jgi:hypothetical protein
MSRGSQRAGAGRSRRSQAGVGGASALVRLGERFARFRRERPRGMRYPDDLKEAALALLREVEPGAVYRTCGDSFRQVMAWKAARRGASEKAHGAEQAQVRVFSVVDEPAFRLEPVPSGWATEPELELRLGPWSVSVPLASCTRLLRIECKPFTWN